MQFREFSRPVRNRSRIQTMDNVEVLSRAHEREEVQKEQVWLAKHLSWLFNQMVQPICRQSKRLPVDHDAIAHPAKRQTFWCGRAAEANNDRLQFPTKWRSHTALRERLSERNHVWTVSLRAAVQAWRLFNSWLLSRHRWSYKCTVSHLPARGHGHAAQGRPSFHYERALQPESWLLRARSIKAIVEKSPQKPQNYRITKVKLKWHHNHQTPLKRPVGLL